MLVSQGIFLKSQQKRTGGTRKEGAKENFRGGREGNEEDEIHQREINKGRDVNIDRGRAGRILIQR